MNVPQSVSESAGAAGGVIWLTSIVLSVALYVWVALALAALFRKSGEQGWKGWVPFLDRFVVLQLGGLSGWLILLILVPVLGLVAVYVLTVMAAHRISVAFGYGTAMTVLAALLFPVWASVLGFGPARWVGPALHTGAPASLLPLVGRTGSPVSGIIPVQEAAPAPATGFVPEAAPASSEYTSAVGRPPSSDFTPEPWGFAPTTRAAARSTPGWGTDAEAFRRFSVSEEGVPDGAVPEGDDPDGADVDDVDRERVDQARPDPARPDPSRRDRSRLDPDDDEGPGWGEGPSDAPITVIPGRRATAFDAPPAGEPAPLTRPLVTRAPLAPPEPPGEVEPWAPRRSTAPAPDEAYDDTGEVSAVVGAPEAGAPRSALASVSALHTRPEVPEDDGFDETVITRRRRAAWVLVPPLGAPIDIFADVIILGRRPEPDSAFPKAQLVPLADDTRTVSKTHARLELRGDAWFVTDLDSTNGVQLVTLMGTEIDAEPGVELAAGERFFLGDAEVRLQRNDG